ncbi:MAG: toprim domain-containing protein [Candidatus Woesearchaeota archaeon]
METLQEWATELKKVNKLIIVEGKKDKCALENLGINKIVTFSNSSYLSMEEINEKEVIILTDLDNHGKKFYSILRHNLQKRGIKIDRKFREFLFQEKISTIESLKIDL